MSSCTSTFIWGSIAALGVVCAPVSGHHLDADPNVLSETIVGGAEPHARVAERELTTLAQRTGSSDKTKRSEQAANLEAESAREVSADKVRNEDGHGKSNTAE